MASFAELLKSHIEADPDLTEAGLARKAGLDNATIRKIVAEGRNPRIDTIRKICSALGTTPEEFMGRPQSQEERDILRLVSQLSDRHRRKLLIYGAGLLAGSEPDDD